MSARRPARIKVGPYTFTVDWSQRGWSDARESAVAGYDPDLGRTYGFTDRRNLAMWINPNAPLELQREALLHEVMHACQAVAALPNIGYVVGDARRPAGSTSYRLASPSQSRLSRFLAVVMIYRGRPNGASFWW